MESLIPTEILGFSEVPTRQVAGCLRSSPGMMLLRLI
jgi:hypothetical protein